MEGITDAKINIDDEVLSNPVLLWDFKLLKASYFCALFSRHS